MTEALTPGQFWWCPGHRRDIVKKKETMTMKKIALLIAGLALIVASPADAKKQQPTLDQDVVVELAEYLSTCGGLAKPAVVDAAHVTITRMGYPRFLELVKEIHVERDSRFEDRFCDLMGRRMEYLNLLGPYDLRSDPPPPPGYLDLTKLPRRQVAR
jgi:hypothetical protein